MRTESKKYALNRFNSLILILASFMCLTALPAFGAVSVTLTKRTGQNIVDVNYSCASAFERPRSFALEVSIEGPAVFTAINKYLVGESNSVPPQGVGYGIYPARMTFWLPPGDEDRDVNYWGRPEADQNDIGAKDQVFPSSNIVLEFASLYYGEVNAPALSGRLCSLTYDCNSATWIKQITAVEEDTYRGGIVLENGTPVEVTVTPLLVCSCPCTKPGKVTNVSPSNGATGVSRASTTLTWTAGIPATSYNVYFGTAATPPRVAVGYTNITYATGAMSQGKLYYWHADANNNWGDPCVGDTWNFRVEECLKTSAPGYNDWANTWGRPDCWCYKRQCRGDINGTKNIQWVALLDLNVLKSAFGKNDTVLGTIANGICADLNHTKNIQRVALLDLNILKSYFGKPETSVPMCDSATVNFWTN